METFVYSIIVISGLRR